MGFPTSLQNAAIFGGVMEIFVLRDLIASKGKDLPERARQSMSRRSVSNNG